MVGAFRVLVGGRFNSGGQMKIMQMSFMIVGVFIFFVLVGLFFFVIVFNDVRSEAEALAREETISSLGVIAAMPELNYDYREALSVDEDKLRVMLGEAGEDMAEFWPVASLEFYKIYPAFDDVIDCPAPDCNRYEILDSGQNSTEKFSSYVSICSRIKESGSVYDRCEVGKIVAGIKVGGGL